MRKFIAREVGRRTGAVKKLVDKYNELASAVRPMPRQRVTYEQVIDAAYLADFPLLRYDTGDARWAQPVVRQMTRAWAEKLRAEEELKRVRVESVRVRTWIRDEELYLNSRITQLSGSGNPQDLLTAHELDARAQRLFASHSKILKDLHLLDIADGRGAPRTAGTRQGDAVLHPAVSQDYRPRVRQRIFQTRLAEYPGRSHNPQDGPSDDEDAESLHEDDALQLNGLYEAMQAIAM